MVPIVEAIDHKPSGLILPMPLKMFYRGEEEGAWEASGDGGATVGSTQGYNLQLRCCASAESYLIPDRTEVHLNMYGAHRDPNFWPNSKVFDPDRFLPEKIRNRHPYSYIPFSAGPRNCIGQRFALLDMKAMISHLIHNFYLEPVDYLKDLTIKSDLVMRPAHPHRLHHIMEKKCTESIKKNEDDLNISEAPPPRQIVLYN
ncbi:cytochrome P450 4c21-like [Temnothorax longispinosus]|uniref:cytochrome P450 4c21-like n=1 Tax=Temnothorax longispinosus TaxID=300112 RepID=UPI003A994B8B